MNVQEEAVTFACGDDALVGVLAGPEGVAPRSAVVIVVGGPQVRVGSHRQFVQLARRLAAGGHAVLRFDVRGMGDSSGVPRSFEALDDDIAAALDWLHARLPQVPVRTLWGLCDGASAALLYCQRRRDARVSALALVNPWLRSAEGLAKTHVKHYYRQRLMQGEFWRKLFSGRVAWSAVAGLARNLKLAATAGQCGRDDGAGGDFRSRMAAGWRAFPGPLLLQTSDDDYTAREFLEGARSLPAWAGALARPGLTHETLAGADHTLSTAEHRLALEAQLLRWLDGLAAKEATR